MADLVRMTAPNGSTVRVSADRAKRLAQQGYVEVKPKKSTTRKSSSDESEK